MLQGPDTIHQFQIRDPSENYMILAEADEEVHQYRKETQAANRNKIQIVALKINYLKETD